MGDFFMSGTKEKKLNLPQSLLLLLLIIVSVAVCIRLKTGGPMIGLFASWIFIYLFCKIFGISYANIVAGAYDAIRMAMAIIIIIPIACCYPFFQKYFISGLTVGAVKG